MARTVWMRIALVAIMALMLILAACSSGSPSAAGSSGTSDGASSTDKQRIKATWITPEKLGDSIALSASTIQDKRIVHFWVEITEGKMPFMAYKLDGKMYVRANLCVPCRSYNYSLEKGILVCDTCGTRFDAKSGDGISGACKAYPKALVPWTDNNGKLVIKNDDAKTAYLNTLEPGWP